MTTVILIVASFLGILGALVLLSQLLVELKWPARWQKTDGSRRSFLVLIVSVLGGVSAGIVVARRKSSGKRQLDLLYDLEIKLIQLEGLILSALSSDPNRLAEGILRQRLRYLNKYKDEIVRLVLALAAEGRTDLSSALSQALDGLRRETERLGDLTPEEQTKVLHNMLEAVGLMRSVVGKAKRKVLGEL